MCYSLASDHYDPGQGVAATVPLLALPGKTGLDPSSGAHTVDQFFPARSPQGPQHLNRGDFLEITRDLFLPSQKHLPRALLFP